MWKKIDIEDKYFIIRISAENNNQEVMLSDFSKIWTESLTAEEILKRCKELNPLYEAEPEVLITRIKELIEPEKQDVKKELLEVGNRLTITFSSYLNGILFRFRFILILATPEKFCQYLTFPLIQMVEELEARNKMLCDLLVKKDVEINEYKMEGATLTRKNVITEPFKEEKFLENCSLADAEKRSMTNLRCPFSFFEKSCSKLYEECTKRKKVAEEAFSPKKNQEEIKVDNEEKERPETSRRKKKIELVYADKEDENDDDETHFSYQKVDDDETYFSNQKDEDKTTVKTEVKRRTVSKKRKLLNL